jgi:hypothetical protein
MAKLHYKVVPHDGGWAYTLQGAFSEPFATHDAAVQAARRAASELPLEGEPATIEYQDAQGEWHTEQSAGWDHPEAEVDE